MARASCCVEGPAGQQQFRRSRGADNAGQVVAGAHVAGRHPALNERRAERRRLCRDPDVAGERKRESAADSGAVDGGDHRLSQSVHLFEERRHQFLGDHRARNVGGDPGEQHLARHSVSPATVGRAGLHVRPRTETKTGAGEDHDAGVRLAGDRVKSVMQFAEDNRAERVAPVGPIDGDQRNARLEVLAPDVPCRCCFHGRQPRAIAVGLLTDSHVELRGGTLTPWRPRATPV